MKRDAKILLDKGIASLILSVELFNRPHDIGRIHAVLIMLDHSFEMLLKACLIHRNCKIIDKDTGHAIGFASCLRKGMGDGQVRFLSEDQILTLQAINGMRDAEQHFIIHISEQQLYVYVQTGFTLFRDILSDVFRMDLYGKFPNRVLPISSTPPMNFEMIFEKEFEEIKPLIRPNSRKRKSAIAKLRALEILERSLQGDEKAITDYQLNKKLLEIQPDTVWEDLFPNVASINIVQDISGPSISLRITKKEGIPIFIVPEGTPGSHVIAIQKVRELGYYNMVRNQLAKAVGHTTRKTDALIWYLKLKEKEECSTNVVIGKTRYVKYSYKAIEEIKRALQDESIEDIWDTYKNNLNQNNA